MAVDFTPSLNGYSGQSKLRYWCQKVLPLVYDDSLSYYELLNKIVDYLNNTIEDVSDCEDNITALRDAFVNLQNYVNEMFEDFEPEIEQIIDEMIDDGRFGEILSSTVNGLIASEYNPNTTYNRYAYCIKDAKLYCAKSTTMGAWDSTKWDETPVATTLTTYMRRFPAIMCNSLEEFIDLVTSNPNGTVGMVAGAPTLAIALHGEVQNCIVLYRYIQTTQRILYTCYVQNNIIVGYVSIAGNVAYFGNDLNLAAKKLFRVQNGNSTVRLVGVAGDYQTIQAACDAANVDDIIIVLPGIYTEQVSIFGKKLHIYGVDKKLCKIVDHTGNYYTPPVEMNIGTLANFTIIEDASQPAEDETNFQAYCIHNDNPTNTDGESLEIANCDLYNERHSCIGFGMYKNYKVYIHDCYMRKNSVDTGEYKYGCLYVHGSTQNNSTNQILIVENCTISSAGDYAARVGIPSTGSGEVKARFIGNKMWSDINGTGDNAAVISRRSNYLFTLDPACNGNSIDKFNIAPNYTLGEPVDITNYGQGNYFIAPSDGYVVGYAPVTNEQTGLIYRIYGKENTPYMYNAVYRDMAIPVFIKKNMRVEVRAHLGTATLQFYALNNL